jgi:hypothetical protein
MCLLIQYSFKRPCEDGSTKRVLNFTQSTVTTRIENGLLAFFEAMLAYHSVAYRFIYAKPNKSIKKSMEWQCLRLGIDGEWAKNLSCHQSIHRRNTWQQY